MTARGLRNNNPGNIELGGDAWQGLSAQQTDGRFAQFDTPEHGIRAMAKVLANYQTKHGLNTPRQMIGRWAPSGENNVDAYVSSVASRYGIDPDKPIDLSKDGSRLISGMIHHENGNQPFDEATIRKAIGMAGIQVADASGGFTLDQLMAEKARRQQASTQPANQAQGGGFTLEQLMAEKARRTGSSAPIVTTERPAGGIQPLAQERQLQPVGQDDPTRMESFGRGAAQGATLGLSDEISAGSGQAEGMSLYQTARNDLGMSHDEANAYQRQQIEAGRDQRLETARGKDTAAQEANPGAFLVGEAAGAISTAAIPGGAVANLAKGGKFGTRVAANAAAAGGQGAAYGFNTGEGGVENRRDNAIRTGAISSGIGASIPFAGKAFAAIKQGLTKGKAASKLRAVAPAIDELQQSARTLFKAAEDSGIKLNAPAYDRLVGELTQDMAGMGLRRKLHPAAFSVLEELQDSAGSSPSMSDLMTLRRVLNMGANDVGNKDQTRLVSAMVEKFDGFLDNLKPVDVMTNGPTKAAVNQWKEGRDLWRRSIKAGVIEDAFKRADVSATGLENGLRTEFRRMAKSPKIMRSFSGEEKSAIRAVANGSLSGNALRKLSKFGFGLNGQQNFIGGSIGVGTGAAVLGPAGAIIVPAIGGLAAKGAQKSTIKGAETVKAMAASGQVPNVSTIPIGAIEKLLLQGSAGVPAVQ